MSENLNHDDYVAHQLREDGKGLSATYRNVILHASIIEGVLRRKTGKESFKEAINALPKGKEYDAERAALHDLRRARNELVHDCFKKGYDQSQIEALRNGVMKKILTVYKLSKYLNEKLFKEYKIKKRPRKIPYQGPK